MDYFLGTTRIHDSSLGYLRYGEGRHVLVVIPGLNTRSVLKAPDLLVQNLHYFARHDFTVYVFDRKDPARYPYSLQEMAQDTNAALHAMQLEKVFLFGHSQGGMIAQWMALLEPELFIKMALTGTVARLNSNSEALFKNWINLAANHDAQGLYLSFVDTLFSPEFGIRFKDILLNEATLVTPEELDVFIQHTANMLNLDLRDELEKLRVASLVIGSKQDKVFDYSLVEELGRLTRGKTHFYAQGSHSMAIECPDLNSRISSFFLEH